MPNTRLCGLQPRELPMHKEGTAKAEAHAVRSCLRASRGVPTDWHCNVVRLGKRPFFLFAHSLSLYAFFVAVAGNPNREAFCRAFREHLAQALVRERLAASAGRKLMDDGPDSI